jgi:hypothetical protein
VENAVRIAAHLGIPLFESASDHFDAVFVRVGSKGAIGVNRNAYGPGDASPWPTKSATPC